MQLMMHDYDDVPKMYEKGTAVSPGLRSFISVETTQVWRSLIAPFMSVGLFEDPVNQVLIMLN